MFASNLRFDFCFVSLRSLIIRSARNIH